MNDKQGLTRRDLVRGSAAALGLGLLGTAPAGTAGSRQGAALSASAKILFQGDSITDAGRSRNDEGSANHEQALGNGYPMLLAHSLLRDYPDRNLQIYNRGISGNKVPDLDARWQSDCLDLAPALLSILVGVNDIWHKLAGNYDGDVADYEAGFAALLRRTRVALPDVTIVVCEPFALRCGAVDERWFPEFDERRAAARRVAETADALWVPFQEVFDNAVDEGSDPEYWAGDGVHPSMAGHSLMEQAWRQAVGI